MSKFIAKHEDVDLKCRLCFCNEKLLIYLYEGSGTLKNVAITITEVLNYKVSKKDGFPPYVCSSCSDKLWEFKAFKVKCDATKEAFELLLKRNEGAKYPDASLSVNDSTVTEDSTSSKRKKLPVNTELQNSKENLKVCDDRLCLEQEDGEDDSLEKISPRRIAHRRSKRISVRGRKDPKIQEKDAIEELRETTGDFKVYAESVVVGNSQEAGDADVSGDDAGCYREVSNRILCSGRRNDQETCKVSDEEYVDFPPDGSGFREDNSVEREVFEGRRRPVSGDVYGSNSLSGVVCEVDPLLGDFNDHNCSSGDFNARRSSERDFNDSNCSSGDFNARRSSERDFNDRNRSSGDFNARRSSERDFNDRNCSSGDFNARRSSERDFNDLNCSSRDFSARDPLSFEYPYSVSGSCKAKSSKNLHLKLRRIKYSYNQNNVQLLEGKAPGSCDDDVVLLGYSKQTSHPKGFVSKESCPQLTSSAVSVGKFTAGVGNQESVDVSGSSSNINSPPTSSDNVSVFDTSSCNPGPVTCITCGEMNADCSPCETCRDGSSDNANQLADSQIQAKGKIFACHLCGKQFPRLFRLKAHMICHTDERIYPCSMCGKRFKTLGVRKLHELRHLKEDGENMSVRKEGLNPCRNADKVLPEVEAYQSSSETNSHSTDVDKGAKDHSLTSTQTKGFSCASCGKKYSFMSMLMKHSCKHALKFTCSTCGKRFARKKGLDVHNRTHTGEKPYGCEICGKRFAKKNNVSVHMVCHSNERPFSCNECGARFKAKSYRDRHELLHLTF